MIFTLLLLALPQQFALPNHKLTPGVARNMSLKTLCTTKWGKDVRAVTQKMKVESCKAYGVSTKCPGKDWELDHLISRELAGADDIKNLWPQPINEARKKDRLENVLHKEVCSEKLPLKNAQTCLADDWVSCYRKHIGPL